jgi:poly-beta-1,6-N-acetyl-D-glucosamine synthase
MISGTTIEIILLVCLGLIAYTFVVYPILLKLLSGIFNKPLKINKEYQPELSIIISAYNEEEYIHDAVESLYKTDYPIEKIKVYVGSDGSTDRTVEIVDNLAEKYKNLFVYNFPRLGKNKVLNQIVPKTETEIILFMDADCRSNKDTILKMVESFSDPSVGAVIATMNSIDEGSNDNIGRLGETLYQKYESVLRVGESRIKSTVNSLGAFYGIRRDVYKPLPSDRVCDDYMPLLDSISMHKRVIFLNDAIVNEVRRKSLNNEISRRIRFTAGAMSTVWFAKKLLNPKYGWISFFLFSHKIIRWLTPVFMIGLLICTVLLPEASDIKMSLLILQGVLYFVALLGWIFEKLKLKFVVFKIPLFYITMNIGFLLGIFRFLAGLQNARWERKEIWPD